MALGVGDGVRRSGQVGMHEMQRAVRRGFVGVIDEADGDMVGIQVTA
ncbi:hypothetical protein N7E01_07835 [Neopusillimonas aromaticivorans]|nr:hypothetical protein [Neopusillimonas aromaticivorans]WJJ94786.1 hypothetical protein N7E01_07835 [Neopusillimonas aromaticivorans]